MYSKAAYCLRMKDWSVLVGLSLLLLLLPTVNTKRILDAWSSIKENFVGNCQINLVTFNGSLDAFLNLRLDHENYVFYRFPIPSDEWAYYQQIPDTFTWAHYNLSVGLQKGREQAIQWQKPGNMQWAVASDHPRQNKSNCIQVTRSVVEIPGFLYREARNIVTEMYLLRKKNVLIHETGIVASKCGYFQLTDACETRFKFIGRKWWNKCKHQLHHSNLTWDSIFDPTISPLLTYKVDSNGKLIRNQRKGGESSRKYFMNPELPLNIYDNLYPENVNATSMIFENSLNVSSVTNHDLLDHTRASICRDEAYWTPLSRPWYPFWQYVPHKVLVITAVWDANYHHFLIDCISRIAPFMDYVRAYPELRIHIRRHELETANLAYRNAGLMTRTRIARLLKIDPKRFISGPFVAAEVIIPRSVKCNEAILHPLQMHRLSQLLLQEAEEHMRWNSKIQAGASRDFTSIDRFHAQAPFVSHQQLDTTQVGHEPKVWC